MPYLHSAGVEIHYVDWGAEEAAETILFVHGSFASSRWWQPVLKRLPQQFRAIVPDLRGCGRSGRPAEQDAYAIPRQAADLLALTEELNLWDFHLVAHSFGGAIAMQFALDAPDRLRSLVLVSTAPAEGVITPKEVYTYLERMQDDRGLLVKALASLMPGHPLDAFFQQLVNDAQSMAPAAFTANARALGDWNIASRVRELRVPTLFIWGDQDIIVGREAIEHTFLGVLGAHRLEVFRQVGHVPFLERPDAFVESLLTFIQEDVS